MPNKKIVQMCLRNVPVLLNVLLNASLGQSCSTNHVCDIECWTECPACSVQHAMSSRNAKQRFSLSIKTKRKRTLKPFLQCLKQKYLMDVPEKCACAPQRVSQ